MLLLAIALLSAPPLALARDVPALTGPVVDEADLLTADDRVRLEVLLRTAWAQRPGRRAQLQILVVRSLDGDELEGFALRAFEEWKLGERGKDDGVLIVVSRDDRKIRIETGYGSEGALTDAEAGRIIRNTLAPAFREGRYGGGLYRASEEVLSALGVLPERAADIAEAAQPVRDGAVPEESAAALLSSLVWALVPWFGFVALLLAVGVYLAFRYRRGAGRVWEDRPWSPGVDSGASSGAGGGDSSGGGGDWGGGGGRSGGGGASGSW